MSNLAVITPLPVITTAPPLSQSRLTLMKCPSLYTARVIEGRKEPQNEFSARGTEFHDIRAAYVSHLVSTRQHHDWDKLDELIEDAAVSEDAFHLLTASRESFQVDPETVLMIEERLYLNSDFQPVERQEDAAYEGKPDLVQLDGNIATITDYKTVFSIHDADTPQGRLYALLLMLHFPFIEKVVFELHFVRYGGAKRVAEYTRSQIDRLQRKAERDRKRQLKLHSLWLQRITPEPIACDQCVFCPLLRTCSIRDKDPFVTEDPHDLLNFAIWAAAALKQSQQVLKAHAGASGPLSVSDGNGRQYVAQFKPIEKVRYPARAAYPLIEAWEEREPGLLDQVGISIGAKLKAKKRRALLESLAEVRQVQTMTRFGISGIDLETTEDTEGTE